MIGPYRMLKMHLHDLKRQYGLLSEDLKLSDAQHKLFVRS